MPWKYCVYIAAGFVLGSVLFSWVIPRWLCGVDIVAASPDHNPGTANAVRYAGWRIGLLCLVCDVGKGFLPVFVAVHRVDMHNLLFGAVLAAPVLGHAFSPSLKGRGGKAIATSFGVLLGVVAAVPQLFFCLAGLFVFFSVIVVLRPHALRSTVTYGLFLGYCLMHVPVLSLAVGAAVIAVTVIVKHILNPEHEKIQVKILGLPLFGTRKETEDTQSEAVHNGAR